VYARGRPTKHGRKYVDTDSVKHEEQKENESLLLNKGRLICEVGLNDAIEYCGQSKDGCGMHIVSDACIVLDSSIGESLLVVVWMN
jgi:hypothetical protein